MFTYLELLLFLGGWTGGKCGLDPAYLPTFLVFFGTPQLQTGKGGPQNSKQEPTEYAQPGGWGSAHGTLGGCALAGRFMTTTPGTWA